jgi:hypothetical protein
MVNKGSNCRPTEAVMPPDTVLCWKTSVKPQGEHVTVSDYTAWKSEGELARVRLATFVAERLRERYIDPVDALGPEDKNGFAVMALCCLLIETLESFYQGWARSPNSELAFCSFFDRHRRFDDFRGYSNDFYRNVRCGILHQGETTGGWTITRRKGHPLFDPSGPRVHATKFHQQLAACVDDYSKQLETRLITDDLWKRFFKKMDATVRSVA